MDMLQIRKRIILIVEQNKFNDLVYMIGHIVFTIAKVFNYILIIVNLFTHQKNEFLT